MSGSFSGIGFCLPPDYPPTENELAWITFLRLLTDNRDPAPTLRLIQELRRILRCEPVAG